MLNLIMRDKGLLLASTQELKVLDNSRSKFQAPMTRGNARNTSLDTQTPCNAKASLPNTATAARQQPPADQRAPSEEINDRPATACGQGMNSHEEDLALAQVLLARAQLGLSTVEHDLLNGHAVDEQLRCTSTS